MTRTANFSSGSHYLDARVTTASQPELQLLMLDAALRFGRQAQNAWHDPSAQPQTDGLVTRTIEVVEELVRGVSDAKNEVSRRLEEEYAFIYRALAQAKLNRDVTQLDAAMRLLAYQRETWRLACENLRGAGVDDGLGGTNPAPEPAIAAPRAAAAPHGPYGGRSAANPATPTPGISLQA